MNRQNPFAGSDSSKARFGGKSNAGPDGVFVVFTWFEGELCPPSNPNQSGKK
jgi:hypothetical protein